MDVVALSERTSQRVISISLIFLFLFHFLFFFLFLFLGRTFSCLLILEHSFHGFLDKHGCAGVHRLLLHFLQVGTHIKLNVVDVISVSLLEAFDGGSNEIEDGLEEASVDNFGAHERPKRQLEPDQEEKLD